MPKHFDLYCLCNGCRVMRQLDAIAKNPNLLPEPTPDMIAAASKNIRWTPEEQTRLIADAAYHLHRNDFKSIPSGNDIIACQMFMGVLRSAQDRQMPPDRRRKLSSRQELNDSFIAELSRRIQNPPAEEPLPFWIKPKAEAVARVTEAAIKELQQQDQAPVPVSRIETPAEPIQVAELPAKSEEAHRVLVSVAPSSLRSFSDDEIFAETHRRFALMLGLPEKLEALEKRVPTAEQLNLLAELVEMQKLVVEETATIRKDQAAMTARMNAFEAELRKVNTAVVEAPTSELIPRVAILGCRKYEMEHIRQGCEEVGLKLDFRHYDQDENPRKIHAEYAISLKWLNHAWDGQIKDAIANGKYVFLNGGVGMAVNQLKTWFQTS